MLAVPRASFPAKGWLFGLAPILGFPGVGANRPLKSAPEFTMPQQEIHRDCHSRRVATDADHWSKWLERLAEMRRESEREEAFLRTGMPVSST
jgi:hypothetical protein